MPQRFIFLDGHTRDDRNTVLDQVKGAINRAGWLLEFTLFSNSAVALVFELELGRVAVLDEELKKTRLHLGDKSRHTLDGCVGALEALDEEQRRASLIGLMHITFVHHDPDLRREVPKVPG